MKLGDGARRVPVLVSHDGMLVLGIATTTSNAAESDPATGVIPGLWARFRSEDLLSQIPGKTLPVQPIGVYTDYEGDQNGRYRLIAGAAVEPGTRPAQGLVLAEVPAGAYLVFTGEGALPNVVVETWLSIWRYFSAPCDHVRAYGADFEVYRGPNTVDIYVGVK